MRHDEAECFDVGAVWLDRPAGRADEIAASLETVYEPVAFELQQGALHRRAGDLQDIGDRSFEQNKAGRQGAFGNVRAQHILGNFVSALRILAEAWLAHAVWHLPFGWQCRPLSLRHLPVTVTAQNKCILHTYVQFFYALVYRIVADRRGAPA
ncbi:hypothetical protein D9M72_499440 [compost metagenome]